MIILTMALLLALPLIMYTVFRPHREKTIPILKCLRLSSSNKLKKDYAKRVGCSDILGHDGDEIQGNPKDVSHRKCITTFAEAANERHVGIDDGKQMGLFTEDTAVGPNQVFNILGSYASSFVKAAIATKLSLYEQFASYMKNSTRCYYSSTVSITFNGTDVTTITCIVECECVPERKGNGGKIDACMIPMQVMSLTLKDGDSEEKILQQNVSIDSGGKTYSEHEECCEHHPRSIAFKALVDLCTARGWQLL
jgi:hypothetical protein